VKFFLDTANVREIEEAASLHLLDGVTTKPLPDGQRRRSAVKPSSCQSLPIRICEIVGRGKDVSAEVIATDFEGMVAEGRSLAELHANIVVKVPMTKDGAARRSHALADAGIRTNCTLVFSRRPGPLWRPKPARPIVSPFIGRLDDAAQDGVALIASIRTIFDNYRLATEILAASIRHVNHVVQCAEAGADVATIPYKVLLDCMKHPLTDIGLERFLADHAALQKSLA
jgi:transaldolase